MSKGIRYLGSIAKRDFVFRVERWDSEVLVGWRFLRFGGKAVSRLRINEVFAADGRTRALAEKHASLEESVHVAGRDLGGKIGLLLFPLTNSVPVARLEPPSALHCTDTRNCISNSRAPRPASFLSDLEHLTSSLRSCLRRQSFCGI